MTNNSDTNQTTEEIQQVYQLPNTKQVMRYYHAAAGLPTKSTWLQAIKEGFYAMWPMLTAMAVMKYYQESNETQKGHMHQNKQGVGSTKQKNNEQEPQVIHLPQMRVQEV